LLRKLYARIRTLSRRRRRHHKRPFLRRGCAGLPDPGGVCHSTENGLQSDQNVRKQAENTNATPRK
jgi:hypothetical protein